MSNDASTSTAAAAPEPAPERRLSTLLRSLSRLPDVVDAGGGAAPSINALAPSHDDATERMRLQRREVQTRHAAMLDGLIRSLDIVAYAQMSILYYMDNSLMRLLLRLLPHWLFFTPKPAAFPPPPRKQAYVLHVAFANLTCALLHIMLAAPSAGEATRGYLHGGFLIDFVGERGPVSKVRLLGADLAVLVVQVVMLAAVRERERMRDAMGGGGSGASSGGAAATDGTAAADSTINSTGQDHDAEEQGIRRDWASDPLLPLPEQDMDGVGVSGDGSFGEEDEDEEEGSSARRRRERQHPLDRFYTGQCVVADLYIWDAILGSWKEGAT